MIFIINTKNIRQSRIHRDMLMAVFCPLLLCFILPASLWATTYYCGVDVPSVLGTTDFTINQFIKSINAAYTLELSLPEGTELTAMHRRADATWLFSCAFPLNLGGTEYESRDVVAYDGTTYSMFLDGSIAGIPEDTRIDSLFLDSSGHPVLSFDVPVNPGGTEYSQSDLVIYFDGFSLYWDAQYAGVPENSNVVGAAVDNAGILVLSFDVPTLINSTEYLPGQLVQWTSGSGFSSYFADASWPTYAQLRDFSFELQSGAGAVPDGRFVPGTPLQVSKAATVEEITLMWSSSCITTDNDYEIYEGTIGNYTSHAQKFCSTSGTTTMTFAPAALSSYYLVVAHNASNEGSYGRQSDGSQRPTATSACRPQLILPCP